VDSQLPRDTFDRSYPELVFPSDGFK